MKSFKFALKINTPLGEKEIDVTEKIEGLPGEALDFIVGIEGGKIDATVEVTEVSEEPAA